MKKYIIEIPEGDYDRKNFAIFCELYSCKLLKKKRGDAYLKIETEDPINFFWLGCNLNFKYESSLCISQSSKILG